MGRVQLLWVVAVALLAAGAGLVAGFEFGRGGAALGAPTPGSGSPILTITAAGTLGSSFGALGRLLANETPGAEVPPNAQQYQGSLAALAQITAVHQAFDVAAAADFRLIPQWLYPEYASWEVVFASNPEVLVFDPTVGGLSGINTTNWAQKIETPGTVLGVANASTDPNGYNAIFVLELEGLLETGSLSSVYAHFFRGNIGGLAVPIPGAALLEPETQVATLIDEHLVQAYITYQSYAVTHHLSYVPLDPWVGLGDFAPAYLARYAEATTGILTTSGGLEVVRGAPVAFAATVPTNAPNATLGDLFVHLVLSPEGAALLTSYGFSPVTPAYSYGPGRIPAVLAPLTTVLPASLASEIQN